MNNYKTHLQALVQLAVSDQNFNEDERKLIYSIGKAHGISEDEINTTVTESLNRKENIDIVFTALSYEEKFEFLYDIIQLMKIDSKVFLSEIKYCEDMAERIGFNKKVVKKISSRVYADPSITSNRERLMAEVKKYEL